MKNLPNHQQKKIALALQAHDYSRAQQIITQLIGEQPEEAAYYQLSAQIYLQDNNTQYALQQFKKALTLDATNPDNANNLGVLHEQLGDMRLAIHYYRQAIKLAPHNHTLQRNLVVALYKDQQFTALIPLLESLRATSEASLQLTVMLIDAYRANQQFDKATICCTEALQQYANAPVLQIAQGRIAQARGDMTEAIACFDALLSKQPSADGARLQRMVCRLNTGCLRAALLDANYLSALNSAHFDVKSACAKVFMEMGQWQQAYTQYGSAHAINKNHVETMLNFAQVCIYLEKYEQAEQLLNDVLQQDRQQLTALFYLYFCAGQQVDWGKAEWLAEKIQDHFKHQPKQTGDINHYIALHLAQDAKSLYVMTKARVRYLFDNGLLSGTPFVIENKRSDGIIRIAYLSPDFNDHCVGLLISDLFGYHDKNSTRIYGYSLSFHEDDYTTAIKSHCDVWRPIAHLDYYAAAKLIRDDDIDILVDLAGHTRGARPSVLCYQPARIQCHFLGDYGTLGLSCVQYLISHPLETPYHLADYYDEKFIHLPQPFAIRPYHKSRHQSLTRAMLGLNTDDVVLCCFNNIQRINRRLFNIWCDILRRCPNSILWLQCSDPVVQQRLINAAQDVASALRFYPRERITDHWPISLADLYLDTDPVSGGTTSLLALSIGLPVLCKLGHMQHSRYSAALNYCLSLDDKLVAHSDDDYIDKACWLINNPAQRKKISAYLRDQAAREQGLYDAHTFIASLEAAFKIALTRYHHGLPPTHITLDDTGEQH